MFELSLDDALVLDNIMSGVFAPLDTFASYEDFVSILRQSRLANGSLWPIPMLLRIDEHQYRSGQDRYELAYQGKLLAYLDVTSKFNVDTEAECLRVYGTLDPKHPSVRKILNAPKFAMTGDLTFVDRFKQSLDPNETHQEFRSRGWKKIVGFQTRNPIHRAHEYVIKSSLETVDGLFLNPLAGTQKDDDVPADVRKKTYEVLLDNYFNRDRVFMSTYPSPMYYAGPREALLHTIVRKNYGCTHFNIGRDHAGVGGFYGPYDAQSFVGQFEEELKINLIFFDMVFYCKKTKSMASTKSAPPGSETISISGTKLRAMLESGEEIPEEVSRPEVVEILREYYKGLPWKA